MITEELARKQLKSLHQEGAALVEEFEAEQRKQPKQYRKHVTRGTVNVYIKRFSECEEEEPEEEQVPEPVPPDNTRFGERYQSWYTRTLPLMKQLAPDRHAEFQSFYAVDMKYYWCNTGKYVIQDFLRGQDAEDGPEQTVLCFKNQLAILKAVSDRLAWSTLESEDHQIRVQQLALLETARKLIKINECAAGVIAGSVLSTYLKSLAAKHQVKFRKLSPPSAELVDALKTAKVFDAQVWTLATSMADTDSRAWSKEEPPTKNQVRDLINGARWLITNIF